MTDATTQLLNKLQGWLDSFILMLPNIGIALVVMALFFFASQYVKKIFQKVLNKFSDNLAVNKLMSNLLTALFLILGLFIGLGILGLDKTVTSLLAGAGIIGLAVGLAFQDPILNIISGVIMSFKKPFNIGDTIHSNGYSGEIKAITLRSTHIKTFTGEDVFIPNKAVLQNPMENYTLTNWRRVDLNCGVSYNDDLEKVEEVAIQAIKDNVPHDESKEIELIYTEFGDSSINFTLRYWLSLSEELNYLKSKSQSIKCLKRAFDSNGISIPFPMRTLEFSESLKIEK